MISSTWLDNEQGRRWERKRLGGHVRRDLWNSVEEHGRRLRGDWGTVPPNLRWGTAHASVPLIFREVVLSDGLESTK